MMESLDELEHPLLGGSPRYSSGTIGCNNGTNDQLQGILVRCQDKNILPAVAWSNYCSPAELNQQQLLDPCSLPHSLESLYPTAPMWGQTAAFGLQRKDYLETTFVDIGSQSEFEKKFLGEEQNCHNISYSTDEDDLLPDYEDPSSECFSETDSEHNFPLMIPQDYLGLAVFSMLCCFWPLGIAAFYLSQRTNKAAAEGDFRGADSASRQALWLAVLSIIFGIVTYICAVTALISYLSGKPP
ncbi:hypothetical protein GJAV_G00132330 [Gymnothorax javanicus]|nr:hypothetical protein GJAV_G00132330 [Gymnothorax javanicus]